MADTTLIRKFQEAGKKIMMAPTADWRLYRLALINAIIEADTEQLEAFAKKGARDLAEGRTS